MHVAILVLYFEALVTVVRVLASFCGASGVIPTHYGICFGKVRAAFFPSTALSFEVVTVHHDGIYIWGGDMAPCMH